MPRKIVLSTNIPQTFGHPYGPDSTDPDICFPFLASVRYLAFFPKRV
jgi:hypothetical protein